MTLPESRQRNQRYSLRGARYRGRPCLSSVPSTPSFRANSVRGSPTAARGWLLTGMLPICAANVLRLSQFGMSSGLSALRCSGGAHSMRSPANTARNNRSGSGMFSGKVSSSGETSVTRSSPRLASTASTAHGYWPSASAPWVEGISI